MDGNQVLGCLARNDKWYLGGGRMVIWAPEFPLWLDRPGFWDHACYLDYKVAPLFTMSVIDEHGHEVALPSRERFWQPDHSSQLYRSRPHDLTVTERRALLPLDVLCSTFEFAHGLEQARTYDIVIWSAQERFESQGIYELTHCRARERDGLLTWQRQIRDPRATDPAEGVMMRYAVALSASQPATSYSIKTSDRQPNYPEWKFTPFYEKLAMHGKLGNEVPAEIKADFGGLTYFGLHYKLTLPPHGRTSLTVFAAIGATEEVSMVALRAARSGGASFRRRTQTDKLTLVPQAAERRPTFPAKRHWRDYFESVPSFRCSDPYIEKYYWYRWYGLHLNTVQANDKQLGLTYPCIFEGVNLGWFRQHITYSAQCHMLETRWMHDPSLAQGSLLNFIENQLEDGSFPGVIKNIYRGDRSLGTGVAFYHANWGMAVRELHRVHPDREFLQKVYEPLTRYLTYFAQVRDADNTALYDVFNHWETGQEFMNRYQQVDPKADLGGNFRMKGVDATVYIYQLQDTLAWMAEELGVPDAPKWREMRDRTRRSVLRSMWSADQQFFFDVDPVNQQRLTAKAATGFYPFMAPGLAGPAQLSMFEKHLFNEKEFWTPYPVPTASLDDPTFSAEGEWKDQRLVCPWNGRTWPMTNSHVIEALSQASQTWDASLQPRAVELINRSIRMLFLDGDVERPSSYEYYNPITGQPPYFRGTDDYMHSWIADLIIKYVAGVQPGDKGELKIRPLPFKLSYFVIDRLKIAGQWVKISWRETAESGPAMGAADIHALPVGLTVWVNQQQVAHRPTFGDLTVQL